MPAKQVKVIVLTMDTELDFLIKPSTTGRELFNEVARVIKLREVWYFGLQYTDTNGANEWIKPKKRVLDHNLNKSSGAIQFSFRVKFFPERAEEEIFQDITLKLFYLQVKVMILSGEIYCDAERSMRLASHAMQVKHGNYDPNKHKPGFLASDRLLPERITTQYRLSKEEWEDRVMKLWAEHRNTGREAAMMKYLTVAQDLEMYGISYFDVKNSKGTDVILGIHADGLNIYDKRDKIVPRISFKWTEMRTLEASGKKFIIRLKDKGVKDFVLHSKDAHINNVILSICMGNDELFKRRRSAISIEMREIHEGVLKEKIQQQLQQDKATRVEEVRMEMGQKQREYEERIIRIQEELKRTKNNLALSQKTIHQLEVQLSDCKQKMQNKEEELASLKSKLHSGNQMNRDQRHHLISEIASRESELVELRSQIDMNTSKTEQLQTEVHRQKSRQSVLQSADFSGFSQVDYDSDDQSQVELPSYIDESKYYSLPENTESKIRDAIAPKILEKLTGQLSEVRDSKMMTDFDRMHMESRKSGLNKYETLRKIRDGNTKRQIELFENM